MTKVVLFNNVTNKFFVGRAYPFVVMTDNIEEARKFDSHTFEDSQVINEELRKVRLMRDALDYTTPELSYVVTCRMKLEMGYLDAYYFYEEPANPSGYRLIHINSGNQRVI